MEWLKQIFEEVFKLASLEGIRFVRIRAIAALIRFVQGLRLLILLQYIILIFCFLNAFSFFFGLYLVSVQLSERGFLNLTWPLGFCAGLFLLSFTVLWLSLREKTWLSMFRIEELVDSVEREEACSSKVIDAEEIERIVEKVLREKFQKSKSRRHR